MDQGSLLLPRNYYINEADYTDQIEAYKNLVVTIASLLKEDGVTNQDMAADVDNMFELEKAIASITVDAPDRRNETEMYNPTTLADLNKDYPVGAWQINLTRVHEIFNIEFLRIWTGLPT